MSVDMVNHPPHYTAHPKGIECIDVIEDNPFTLIATAIKYLWRVSWGSKGRDLEDLKKARWYIEREITRRERSQQEADTDPIDYILGGPFPQMTTTNGGSTQLHLVKGEE
jgi:hypothetical protein